MSINLEGRVNDPADSVDERELESIDEESVLAEIQRREDERIKQLCDSAMSTLFVSGRSFITERRRK